jgi:hypothetical protein
MPVTGDYSILDNDMAVIRTNILWHIGSKPEVCNQQGQPLLGNGSVNTSIARQRLSNHHVITATVAYTTIELLEVVFTVWSMPRLYNEEQLPYSY